MQVITVGSTAQDLCTKLASIAVPGFFDSVEMEDGSTTTVECKKNDVVVFKISYQGLVVCTFPNGSDYSFYRSTSYYDNIPVLVVTDKLIYFKNLYGNGALCVIAKDTNESLAFVTILNGSDIDSFSSGAISQPVSIFKEDGSAKTRSYFTNNDDTNKKAYFVPLFVNDDVFVDGVYVGLVRPYPNEPGYMPFMIGSTEYVGFSGTTFIAKA